MDDTCSYHIQMVKWIQDYGSVPGVANLHLRFGFNSSWFVSIAMFSYPVPGWNTYGALNGLLSLWVSFYLLEIIFNSSKTDLLKSVGLATSGFVLLVICLLDWPMIRGSASSANYDFISTCCIIILFTSLIENQAKAPVEWLFWPAYLFTVRMTNAPLIILSIIYLHQYLYLKSAKKIAAGIFFMGIIIVPFIVRNVILSGYPLFPFYQIDFFSVDWKADKMSLVEISKYIKFYNRINPAYQPISVTENLSFPNWISGWFRNLFRFDKMVLILSILGYFVCFSRLRKMRNRLLQIFLCVMLFHLTSWFLIAPDPRFVYGPLLAGIFVAILSFNFSGRVHSQMVRFPLVCVCLIVGMYVCLKVAQDAAYKNFLRPYKVPLPPFKTIVVGGIEMRIPEKILNNWNPRCYDLELPCLYRVDPRLEARGKKVADGFRLRTNGKYIFTGGEYKITE